MGFPKAEETEEAEGTEEAATDMAAPAAEETAMDTAPAEQKPAGQ